MKIGILHQYGLGGSGSGVYALHLADALSDRNHQVAVMCRGVKNGYRKHHFTTWQLSTTHAPVMYPRCERDASPCYRDMSTVQIQAHLEELTDQVSRFLEREQPDALIVNHLFPLPVALRRALRGRSLPVATCSHGTALQYLLDHRPDLARIARRSVGRTSRIVVALNRDMRRRLHGFAPELGSSVSEIPVGVDADLFQVSGHPLEHTQALADLSDALEGPDNDDCRGLLDSVRRKGTGLGVFVGRMVQDKGVDELVEALRSFDLQRANMAFLIVGDGPLAGTIREAVAKLRAQGKPVGYVPNLSRREIANLYASASFSVVPSVANEAFPLVMVESLASGLVPLVPNHSGFRTLNGDVGRVLEDAGVDPRRLRLDTTPGSIRRSIRDGLEAAAALNLDLPTRHQLRSLVLPRFDWGRVADRYLEALGATSSIRQTGGQRYAGQWQNQKSATRSLTISAVS